MARLDNNCYPRAPKRRVAHATTTGHRYAAARPMANRNRYIAARRWIGRISCPAPAAFRPPALFGRAEPNTFLALLWRNMDAGTRPRHPPPATRIAVPPGHPSASAHLSSLAGTAATRFLAISQYSEDSSIPIKCRPVRFAATAVVPEPRKGSSIVISGIV